MKRFFIQIGLVLLLQALLACSGSSSQAVITRAATIAVNNPDGLRSLVMRYKMSGQDTSWHLDTITSTDVKFELPAFTDSLVFQYSITTLGISISSRTLVFTGDSTTTVRQSEQLTSVIAALSAIEHADTSLKKIPLSRIYDTLIQQYRGSRKLTYTSLTFPSQKGTGVDSIYSLFNKTGYLNADTMNAEIKKQFNAGTIDFALVTSFPVAYTKGLLTLPSLDSIALKVLVAADTTKFLPYYHISLSQVDSIKMAILHDSIFDTSLVTIAFTDTLGATHNFGISRYELTQAKFRSLLTNNPSAVANDTFPVTNMTLYEVALYCNALTKKNGSKDTAFKYDSAIVVSARTIGMTNLTLNASSKGFRIPTDLEWQAAYTSKMLGAGPFYWGAATDLTVNKYADVSISRMGAIQKIGLLLPNPAGIFDLDGNVSEWVIKAGSTLSFGSIGGNYSSTTTTAFAFAPQNPATPQSWLGFRIIKPQ